MIIVFAGLCKGNCLNLIGEIRVKSHKGLKGTEVFAFGCSVRNLKNFSKFTGRNPCCSAFIVTLQPGIAYKKAKVKVTRATLSKNRRLHRDSYTRTFL